MIKSMTGYGKSIYESEQKSVTVEIRTLNSKQFDMSLRTTSLLKVKELEIRNLLSQKLSRGKIDVSILYHSHDLLSAPEIDKKLALHYYRQMNNIYREMHDANQPDYLSLILKMPDVFITKDVDLDDATWEIIYNVISETIKKVDDFRKHEGEILSNDFKKRIKTILELLEKVKPLEEVRIVRIKERIKKHINEYLDGIGVNPERLEQEMLYYIEKLDITEEKIRLNKHCNYFLTVLDKEESVGKKLMFVTQEIGREINTLGSKANDADLQRIVVLMKDELEKIKEQLFNIL